jgi:RNA polymerase sigma-70 factor, ECF subfamily
MTRPLVSVEDGTLIKLALEGQTECFTVLMDRHLVAVRRRVTSMIGGTTDVEDVLQDVLLKVWRHLSTFRSESSFRTWMTRVAMNEALQLYRRNQRRLTCQPLGDLDAFASPNESPHQCFARAQATEAVRNAVDRLPNKYKQVLILRDLEELSARETARWLRTTVPTVKTRLFRARLMLCAALERSTVQGMRNLPRPKIQRPAIDEVPANVRWCSAF